MAEYKGKLLKGLFTKATSVLLNDGTDVETTISNIKTWNVAGTVTTTTAVAIAIPNTAKEVLALLKYESSLAIYASIVIPYSELNYAISLKNPADTSKELYYNGSKWRVTDAAYSGKIYYR